MFNEIIKYRKANVILLTKIIVLGGISYVWFYKRIYENTAILYCLELLSNVSNILNS